MDAILLILSALKAGAAFAGKDIGKKAIEDAYNGLKKLIKGWFEENKMSEGKLALDKFEEKPEVWERLLRNTLIESGVDNEEGIIKGAYTLIAALKETTEGKKIIDGFHLDITNSQIGIIGDNAKIEGGVHFGKKE
jgi:hypothetical protein